LSKIVYHPEEDYTELCTGKDTEASGRSLS